MRPVVLLLSVGALTACSPAATSSEKAGSEPATPTALGSVPLDQPLRLLGTEPFWGIDLNGRQIVYSGIDRPEEKAPQAAPTVQGTMATWTATTDKNRVLEIQRVATECSDGMSDRIFPLTAIVKIGDETLNGCAATVSALQSAGESGLVVDKAA